MGKTFKHLFPEITSFSNLNEAFQRARRNGKRKYPEVATFELNVEEELLRLQAELCAHTYRPGAYRHFYIYERKRRKISAAPFRDRVVHHALCRIIEPIFEARFIADSYACRKDKGTHRAIERAQEFARTRRYLLQCDVRQFFPSIDHAILRGLLARYIADADAQWLINQILASGADALTDEYTLDYFPGDDLFAANRPRGLPIGNLTSQFWANVYLNELDYFVKHELRCHGYVRYADDFLLFHDDKATLRAWRAHIIAFLETLRLHLHAERAVVTRTPEGFDFLGWRVLPHYLRLRHANARAFARRLRGMAERYAQGELTTPEIQMRIRSWIAHAEFGNTYRLRQDIFRRVIFAGGSNAELAGDRKNVRPDCMAHSTHPEISQESTLCHGKAGGR